jgi:hypothetical protein
MAGLVTLLTTNQNNPTQPHALSYMGGDPSDTQAERDIVIGDKKDSQMHFFYSTTGNPGFLASSLPNPSGLDINATLQSPSPLGPLQDPANPQLGAGFLNGNYPASGPIGGYY